MLFYIYSDGIYFSKSPRKTGGKKKGERIRMIGGKCRTDGKKTEEKNDSGYIDNKGKLRWK